MIYLDNASTTKVSNVACKAAVEVMLNKYGNPSSVHGFGLESEMIIRNAREIINKIIDGESRDLVYFTSGGTEANNLAITGSAKAKSKQGKGIVCSEYEHSSCYEAVKELEKLGYTVTYVKPEKDGTINPVTFADAVCCDTVLAVCMAVNNETGGINNIARMVKLARKKNPSVHFHCDGVQAFCKIPISAKKWDVDSLSVSGHKIAAPKGIGALYLKKGVRILPSIYGGSQQNKVRPGTENLSGIAAMGAACEDYYENGHKYNEKIEELNLYAKEVFANKGIKILSGDGAISNIISISVAPIKSETMLHYLEQQGIMVSSGSACSKGEKSHVVQVWPIDEKDKDSVIRVSFGRENTREEVRVASEFIAEGIKSLKFKGV